MLVAVVLFFVATELPQGVLALLSGIDKNIFEEVYVPLGDVFDLLVLVNSAVNFVLYCSMSRQFRRTFTEVFVDPLCSRKDKASAAAANGRVIVVGGKRSPGGGSGRRV
jgi:thyrotropin-releasing hormone receptor